MVWYVSTLTHPNQLGVEPNHQRGGVGETYLSHAEFDHSSRSVQDLRQQEAHYSHGCGTLGRRQSIRLPKCNASACGAYAAWVTESNSFLVASRQCQRWVDEAGLVPLGNIRLLFHAIEVHVQLAVPAERQGLSCSEAG